jgi:drug/metabolite transporter (DMT)-like permease
VTAPVRRVWLALAVVYVLWGSTYFAIKIAVRTLPPLLTAGLRFAAAGILLAGILALRGTSLRVSRRELVGTGAAGLLLLTLGVGVVHVAETRIDSSVAAMIVGTVPLQVIALRTLARERVAQATRLSTLSGLAGLALVIVPDLGSGSTAFGLALMVGASVSWSFGSFASRRLPLPRDPFVATTWEMLWGGVLLSGLALALGEGAELSSSDLEAGPVAAWLYLIVAGSVVGFTAYAWLLQSAPISLVVTHQYVNPLVAIALGTLFLDERLPVATLAGAVLIVSSVYVAVRAESASGARLEVADTAREEGRDGDHPQAREQPDAEHPASA